LNLATEVEGLLGKCIGVTTPFWISDIKMSEVTRH